MNLAIFSFSSPRPGAGGVSEPRWPGLVLLLGLALLLAPAARAQPTNGGPGADPVVEPTETPLDGGASLLLAGGIGYAVRRLRRKCPQ